MTAPQTNWRLLEAEITSILHNLDIRLVTIAGKLHVPVYTGPSLVVEEFAKALAERVTFTPKTTQVKPSTETDERMRSSYTVVGTITGSLDKPTTEQPK